MKQISNTIKVRQYGNDGPFVIILHGGPAAPGYMKPVAMELGEQFRVIEPFQRGSSNEPLTVAQHIQDLQQVIEIYCCKEKPMLVGHSWGAMLTLAWAAEYPDNAKGLILIGSGTFDLKSREKMQMLREARMTTEFRQRLDRISEKYSNPNVRLAVLGGMYQQLDSVDLIKVTNDLHTCDAVAHEQTWNDVVRLQNEGVYPKTFAAINIPVLMLHGDKDPHPGEMIRDSLLPFLPQLEYFTWPQCGHYPWLEKTVRDDFYKKLIFWLIQLNK